MLLNWVGQLQSFYVPKDQQYIEALAVNSESVFLALSNRVIVLELRALMEKKVVQTAFLDLHASAMCCDEERAIFYNGHGFEAYDLRSWLKIW
jgi:hypothetical protein